jgi:hypothetical protein
LHRFKELNHSKKACAHAGMDVAKSIGMQGEWAPNQSHFIGNNEMSTRVDRVASTHSRVSFAHQNLSKPEPTKRNHYDSQQQMGIASHLIPHVRLLHRCSNQQLAIGPVVSSS